MLLDRNDELCVLHEKVHLQEQVIAQVWRAQRWASAFTGVIMAARERHECGRSHGRHPPHQKLNPSRRLTISAGHRFVTTRSPPPVEGCIVPWTPPQGMLELQRAADETRALELQAAELTRSIQAAQKALPAAPAADRQIAKLKVGDGAVEDALLQGLPGRVEAAPDGRGVVGGATSATAADAAVTTVTAPRHLTALRALQAELFVAQREAQQLELELEDPNNDQRFR